MDHLDSKNEHHESDSALGENKTISNVLKIDPLCENENTRGLVSNESISPETQTEAGYRRSSELDQKKATYDTEPFPDGVGPGLDNSEETQCSPHTSLHNMANLSSPVSSSCPVSILPEVSTTSPPVTSSGMEQIDLADRLIGESEKTVNKISNSPRVSCETMSPNGAMDPKSNKTTDQTGGIETFQAAHQPQSSDALSGCNTILQRDPSKEKSSDGVSLPSVANTLSPHEHTVYENFHDERGTFLNQNFHSPYQNSSAPYAGKRRGVNGYNFSGNYPDIYGGPGRGYSSRYNGHGNASSAIRGRQNSYPNIDNMWHYDQSSQNIGAQPHYHHRMNYTMNGNTIYSQNFSRFNNPNSVETGGSAVPSPGFNSSFTVKSAVYSPQPSSTPVYSVNYMDNYATGANLGMNGTICQSPRQQHHVQGDSTIRTQTGHNMDSNYSPDQFNGNNNEPSYGEVGATDFTSIFSEYFSTQQAEFQTI